MVMAKGFFERKTRPKQAGSFSKPIAFQIEPLAVSF